MPRLLGMQRGVVDDRSQLPIRFALSQDTELLLRPNIVARKAKELKQESARSDIHRVIAEIVRYLLGRLAHLSRVEKLLRFHWHGPSRLLNLLGSVFYQGTSFSTSQPLSTKPCSLPSFSGL